MVEIKFIGFIAEKMGTQVMKVSLKQPVKLKDIVEVELSKDRAIVLINQKRGTLDSLIKNGDKVMIMPVVSGG
ncbi:MAG: MoaD/ThiS family protein [Desulfobacterales bacterium]|nr:MAG: MoaD/ThiS family protein [Desulfobacterales bacterium]